MTKRKPAQKRVRTAAALRADASLLVGSQPRGARAAIDDDSPDVEKETTTAELWLYGVVGGYWYGFNADSVSRALRTIDADVIYVRIHSPGGLASDGVAIGNLFRNHTSKIVVVVDGMAASAASVIAIAGDEIVMCPGSQMMLHDASAFEYGNAGDHRKIADWLDGQSQNYAGVYANKAGGTAEQWRQIMLANDGLGTWYTAEEAVTAGLADSVGTRPAAGSPPTAPDDDALSEDDDELLARVEHDLRLLEQAVHPAALAAWQGQANKPPNASAGGSSTTEGGSAVAFSDEQLNTLRSKLGLPETADEAAIMAAVETVVEENDELGADAPDADAKAAPGIPEGHVVIPEAQLSDLKANASAGAAAAEKLRLQERESFLDANRTKFAKTNRGAWAKEYDRDPEGTRKHFASAPEIIPAEMLGHEHDAAGADSSSTEIETVRASDAYKNWEM